MRSERQNPNARNFGLQSRDMAKAGKNALKEASKSYSTIATVADRFKQFADYMHQAHSIQDMRRIELTHVQQYAQLLKDRVANNSLKPATAQNYLSAVNRVMSIARGDNKLQLNPVNDAQLDRRSQVATIDKSKSNSVEKINQLPERFRVQYELCRALGLRFEEAAKMDCRQALQEARIVGQVTISKGVKGGHHDRYILNVTPQQILVLKQAARLQRFGDRSLIPSDQSYREFRERAYSYGIKFHAGRHEYAQNRYQQLTGVACPVVAGIRHGVTHIRHMVSELGISEAEARELNEYARLVISEELGHHRVDVTNAYLG